MAYKRDKAIKIAKDIVSALRGKFRINQAYLFGSYANVNPTQ